MTRTFALVATVLGAVVAMPLISTAQSRAAAPRGLTADTQKRLVESLNKAEAYLRQQQAADGIWEKHPGITALAITAILQQPNKPKAGQMAVVAKSLDYLVGLVLEPPAGVTLAKTSFATADAEKHDGYELALSVPMSAAAPGHYRIPGTFRFAVCDDGSCYPKKRAVELILAVQ